MLIDAGTHESNFGVYSGLLMDSAIITQSPFRQELLAAGTRYETLQLDLRSEKSGKHLADNQPR